MEPIATRAWIGLGANLGDAKAALHAAIEALARFPGTTLLGASSMYRSSPVESSGPDYLNAVAWIETRLDPHALLAELQRVEHEHGRERPYRNAPRTLDLDLLVYGDRRIETATLSVPHPRLHTRAFVLRPLAEVAPDLVVPGRGQVRILLEAVADQRADRLVE